MKLDKPELVFLNLLFLFFILLNSIFILVGAIPAGPVPQDGCALLHCEEQGSAGPCRAQEDHVLHCHHSGSLYMSLFTSNIFYLNRLGQKAWDLWLLS